MDSPVATPGPQGLRALAHPVRLRLLGLLRSEGSSTATLLAARLGLNSGATSYHLRQLAEHGFVVEDPEHGTGRERWWRAAHQATAPAPEHDTSEEGRAAADAFAQAVALFQAETVQRAVEERPLLPDAWRRASVLSDRALVLTPARAHELREELDRLLRSWEEEPDAEGAEEVVVLLDLFPRPGRPAGGEPS
jgi:DNA-binding transcriptional ArsR family regulator